jgi:hypothetical protein
MLNVIMLSVIILNAKLCVIIIMLTVIMPGVIILSVFILNFVMPNVVVLVNTVKSYQLSMTKL